MNERPLLKISIASALLGACVQTFAAGGHHAVDDAAIDEPGSCKLEGWASRFEGGDKLLNASAGCVVGPVEWSIGGERVRATPSSTAFGLQAKWAHELSPGVSVGAIVSPGWERSAGSRYAGTSLVGLATWRPREDWSFHLNLGRDFAPGTGDSNRAGVSAEWNSSPSLQWVVERYLEERAHFARVGARWAFAQDWSVDLSRARRLAGDATSFWTLGITRVFEAR